MVGGISDEGLWCLDMWFHGPHLGGLLMGAPGDGVLGHAFYLAGPCGHKCHCHSGEETVSGLVVADPKEREGWRRRK